MGKAAAGLAAALAIRNNGPAAGVATQVRAADTAAPLGGVAGGAGATALEYTGPTFDDIDIVIMYANGSDPVHARERARAGGPRAVGPRDRDNNELRFLLRSIDANMPWFRGMVYILTDTPPTFINYKHPRVRVALHSDTFPPEEQRDTVPSFSSDAIMTTLTRIPGIKDLFIKFDDDNVVASPTTRQDFVTDDGRTRLFYERHLYRGSIDGREDEPRINKLKKAGQTWLAKMYRTRMHFARRMPELRNRGPGQGLPTLFRFSKHAPVVFRKDLLQRMYDHWADEFAAVRKNRFRGPDGLDPHAMYSWWCPLVDGGKWCTSWDQDYMDKACKLIVLDDKNDNSVLHCMYGLADTLLHPPKFLTL